MIGMGPRATALITPFDYPIQRVAEMARTDAVVVAGEQFEQHAIALTVRRTLGFEDHPQRTQPRIGVGEEALEDGGLVALDVKLHPGDVLDVFVRQDVQHWPAVDLAGAA